MKKLNNKGFAISTLLYGLMLVAFLVVSLLMSIMSTNRKNTSNLIRKIEEELNRYSQTATELSSTEGTQEFIVPYGKAGWYKIELWGAGAAGIDAVNETENGRGAYTSGIIYLEENTHLYFQIGTQGGSGGTTNNTYDSYGGGATDVRLVGGNWDNTEGLTSRIMVAAGGGYSSSHTGTGFGGAYLQNNDGGSYISGYAGLTAHDTYKFLNPVMFMGVNAGEGKAKIELISTSEKSNPPTKKTTTLQNVRYIMDCIYVESTQNSELWREISAIDSTGTNQALNKPVSFGIRNYFYVTDGLSGMTDGSLNAITTKITSSVSSRESCIKIDLGQNYNLEEITVFHNKPSSVTDTAKYKNEMIAVLEEGGVIWRSVKHWNYESFAPTETWNGVKISDRNPEVPIDAVLPGGNYYIVSAMSDNRLLTVSSNSGSLSLFNGNKNQRWSISHIDNGVYKILDGADQMALQPEDGGIEAGETLNNATKYNDHDWEKWTIRPVTSPNNGYYLFESGGDNPSNLCIGTRNTNRNASGLLELKTCDATDRSQWFKLVNADY